MKMFNVVIPNSCNLRLEIMADDERHAESVVRDVLDSDIPELSFEGDLTYDDSGEIGAVNAKITFSFMEDSTSRIVIEELR